MYKHIKKWLIPQKNYCGSGEVAQLAMKYSMFAIYAVWWLICVRSCGENGSLFEEKFGSI